MNPVTTIFQFCLLGTLIFALGCGVPRERDKKFVGQYQSGLPVDRGHVPGDTPQSKALNRSMEQKQRAANASGKQGIKIDIQPNGKFTLVMWEDMGAINDFAQAFGLDSLDEDRSETESKGTWYSQGNRIFLQTQEPLPFGSRVVSRDPWTQSIQRHGTYQVLPLYYRPNGDLSEFKPEHFPKDVDNQLLFKKITPINSKGSNQ